MVDLGIRVRLGGSSKRSSKAFSLSIPLTTFDLYIAVFWPMSSSTEVDIRFWIWILSAIMYLMIERYSAVSNRESRIMNDVMPQSIFAEHPMT